MRHAPEEITAPSIPPTRLRSPLPAPGTLGGKSGRWSKGVGLSNPWMFPPPRLTWHPREAEINRDGYWAQREAMEAA